MSDVVIMLMTCKKNLHTKVEIAKQTWLDKCGVPYVLLVGEPDLSIPYRFDPQTRLLEVQCPDDYESLSKKVYLGIIAVNAEFAPSGILKIDDDVLVRVNKLQAFVASPNKQQYEGDIAQRVDHWSDYHVKKCKDSSPVYVPNVKYCRGPIYYIGSESINAVCNVMDPDDHLYEDVLMGSVLNKSNIYPRQQPFMTDYLNEFKDNNNIIALHDIDGVHDFLKLERDYNINSVQSIESVLWVFIICAIFVVILGALLFFFTK